MAKPKFDKLVVVDLECLCWNDRDIRPPHDEMEIIEIGVCHLDLTTLEIEKAQSIYVRPDHGRPSEYCHELTGINWDKIKGAPNLKGACSQLIKRFGTKNRLWASWGVGDMTHFQRQCELKGVDYPFWPGHIDLNAIFSMLFNYREKINLEEACKRAEVEFEGVPHIGKDDAVTTAKLLANLMSLFRVNLPNFYTPYAAHNLRDQYTSYLKNLGASDINVYLFKTPDDIINVKLSYKMKGEWKRKEFPFFLP